jgi:hypothetical protein
MCNSLVHYLGQQMFSCALLLTYFYFPSQQLRWKLGNISSYYDITKIHAPALVP